MAEIKREPFRYYNDNGETFVVFDDDHTHSDVLRYVASNIGWDDIRSLADILSKE